MTLLGMRMLGVIACLSSLACSSASSPGGAVAAGASGSAGASPGLAGANSGMSPGGIAGAAGSAAGASTGGAVSGAAGAAGVAGERPGSGGAATAGAGGSGGTAGVAGNGGAAGGSAVPPKASGVLCVFDYDLTLSTNNCTKEQYDCRTNVCLTYNWYQQCMSSGARHAIEVCAQRGAYIGIASHASVDLCWDDKVATVISQVQFPGLTSALRYDNPKTDFSYPKIDLRSNWNCDTCAYHMNGAFTKPQLISKVMAHYGMDAKKPADRAKVIFWDDLPDNITKTNADMPEVHTVHVHENIDGQPNSGGCGILESDVDAGWAAFPK